MEIAKSEDPSKDRKSSNKSAAHRHSKSNVGQTSHNSPNNGFVTTTIGSPCSLPVPDTPSTPSNGAGQLPRSVKKSKTYDCVRGMGLQQPERPKYKDGTNWRHQLVTSVSFSGFDAPLRLLCENQDISGSSHEIIDYRNLTPQVPFVPCIAKSIPKKRISPRKAIKDLFVHKRHKHEKALSPSTPCRVARVNAATSKRTKKSPRHKEHARSWYNEHSETSSDSSGEYSNVCEDVASLKSFGSQSGCGEIFADEDCIVSPDRVLNPICDHKASEPQVTHIPTVFQGGNECLASPAHVEVLDMFGLWETLNRTRTESSRALGNTTETTSPTAKSPSTNVENVITNPLRPLEAQIRKLNTDVISPKSDNPENASDEGYCDYVSPVSEDHSKNSLTPVHSKTFPRDTYSGDALYELFCDPSEAEMTPIFDDELDLTDSIIGQCSDLPLSMYSFHVGAEENLAPPLARDFIGPELLQSKWMGKDCLLKLCDTEISLAMGIVNWLKQKTDKSNPAEIMSTHTSSEETDQLCMKYKTQSTGVGKPQRGTVNDGEDVLNFKESNGVPKLDLPSQYEVNTVMSTIVSPESLPKTPSSGVCFRIYNIDSPMTPSGDLQSPVVSSPGSGTRSLFVLAINKESLCESCKHSLKSGAKKLSLCRSCRSLIEHIKTSDVWAHSSFPQYKTLTPQQIHRDLLSPASTCAIGSDISIASLVEQCASQFSSMKMNLTQKHLSCGVFEPDQGVKGNTENFQKYLKSKCKKTPIAAAERESGLYSRLCLRRPSLSEGVHKPSLLETEVLGFVTNNSANDMVLETYKNPSCTESDDLVISQTTRPTSLPLMTSTSSEFSCGEDHHLKRMEHGSRTKKKHRLPHHKKSALNSEGSCGYVLPKERKVERRYRMKK